jgi:hypothetical protein
MGALQLSFPPTLSFALCTSENASVFLLHLRGAARLSLAASCQRWLIRARRTPHRQSSTNPVFPTDESPPPKPPENQIMKIHRERQSTNPFPSDAPSGDAQESDDGFRDSGHQGLPEGWRRLPTGLRGARLYRIAIHGGEAHWQAEMTLNGEMQRRSFASELHARWWLAALEEPRLAPSVSDWEELNAPWSADFVRSE